MRNFLKIKSQHIRWDEQKREKRRGDLTCGLTTYCPRMAACRSSLDSRSRVRESTAVWGLGRGSPPPLVNSEAMASRVTEVVCRAVAEPAVLLEGAAWLARDSCSGRLRWVAAVGWVVVVFCGLSRDPAESRLKMFNENSVFCVG